MSTSRLSTAVQELERALAALDETMQAAAQNLPAQNLPTQNMPAQNLHGRDQTTTEAAPSVVGDLVPAKQVREELIAVQQMVSSAAELIALARTADRPKPKGPSIDGQEVH